MRLAFDASRLKRATASGSCVGPDERSVCPSFGQNRTSSRYSVVQTGQIFMKKLGEGGMGQVYLAEHVKMGRRSAIKVMNPSMVHDSEGLIYLAMEFIDGEPLTELIRQEGALPVSRAADIAIQVAAALQAAHDLDIVHRDLKPDNIMLTRSRDGSDAVKVVDFGLAKAVGGEGGGQKVTRTGLVVGTPEFMSPEQLSGDKLDGRTDVYSLGLVLFNMLTGTLPFPADSVQEAMIKRLTDEPAELLEVRPDLHFPPGLQQILDTALARNPVDRYQSAAKFAHDLAAVAGLSRDGGAGLPATLSGSDDKTELIEPVRTRKRSRVPIAVGVIVVLGAAGAVVMIGRTVKQSGGVPPADTAQQITPSPPPVDTATRAPVVTPRRGLGKRARAPVTGPRIDVARAQELLDTLYLNRLVPKTARWVGDSALHIFNAPGIKTSDKAYAALVYGIALVQMNDREQGCEWVRKARDLNPTDTTYAKILARC